MSHIDTLDPKRATKGPKDPITSRRRLFSSAASCPRWRRSRRIKLAIIRSMTSKTGVHASGQYLMRTAYEQRGTIKHPTSVPGRSSLLGPSHKTLPSSVCMNRNPQHGNGFFPAAHSPLPIHDPSAACNTLSSARPADHGETLGPARTRWMRVPLQVSRHQPQGLRRLLRQHPPTAEAART
jgi:hypothetical protein